MNLYFVGTTVELDALFEDQNGDPGDPDSIIAEIIDATGALSYLPQESIVRRGLGDYFIQYVPTVAGLYQYRIVGYQPFFAAASGAFYAQTSFPYVTLLKPGTGEINIESEAPTLAIALGSISLTPGAGALVLASDPPAIVQKLIAPNAGAIALTGQAASVLQNNICVPGTGALGLQGGASTLGTNLLTITKGDIALTHIAPVVIRGTVITPAAGAIAMAGAAATALNAQSITPAPASLSLVGGGSAQNIGEAPPPAALALTGAAPVVMTATTITPTVGAIALTGQPSVPALTLLIVPGTGNISMQSTVAAPVVMQNSNMAPVAGSIALTGNQPNLTQVIQPLTGSITLTGVAPPLAMQETAGAGSLILTGVAPTLIRGTNIAPLVGSIALAGVAPVVTRQTNIAPSAGAIALAGVAPTVSIGSTFAWSSLGTVLFNFKKNVGITEVSGAVSAWADQTGAAHDLLQGTATNRATKTAQGGLLFDGIDNYMRTAGFVLTQPYTIFIRVNPIVWAGNARIFSGDVDSVLDLVMTSPSPGISFYQGGDVIEDPTNLQINAFNSICCVSDTAVGACSIRIGANTKVIGFESFVTCGGFTLGCDGVLANFANFEVREIACILGALSDADQTTGINYLNTL